MSRIQSHEELDVYQLAFKMAMRIFALSKSFPPEERYALTDQMRRSSRSVCNNIVEAWRKRRYEAAFVSKLNDAEQKPPRPRPGLRLLYNLVIGQEKWVPSCGKLTIMS